MLSRTVVVLALTLLSLQCFGAAPIATVMSTQPIVISGITVPTNRAMSWPGAANDEIGTQTAPAPVRFTDGAFVTLQRNSRMKLQPGPAGVEVKMLSGSAIYDVKPKTSLAVSPGMTSARASAAAPVLSAALRTSSSSISEAEATAFAYRMP